MKILLIIAFSICASLVVSAQKKPWPRSDAFREDQMWKRKFKAE